MPFHDKFGQTVSSYDLSRRRETEQKATQKPKAPPKGSPYDLGYVARVNRYFSGKPRRTNGGYSL